VTTQSERRRIAGRQTRVILIVSVLVLTGATIVRCMSGDRFLDGLQYELNNRAFARASMTKLANEPSNGHTQAFFRAYLALENLNQQKYEPIAHKYDLSVNDGVVALKIYGARAASWMFSEKMLSVLTDATIAYVEKLRTLRDLAPADDRAFFEYVIAQEQAQADALQHARDGRFDLGAKVLEDFVADHLQD